MSLDEDKRKIEATMIIEVVGRPPEHLVETLEDISKKIGEEPIVELVDKKIHEPVLMKDQKDFFTSFAEIDVRVDSIIGFLNVCFKYMPAHVEITYPENFKMQNNDFNDIANGILQKLHTYDEVVRINQMEKNVLEKKLKALMPPEEKEAEKIQDKKDSEKVEEKQE